MKRNYLIDLREKYSSTLYDFRDIVIRSAKNIEVITKPSIQILGNYLIADNKAFYPENTVILTSKYYGIERRALDMLKTVGFLVDSYLESVRITEAKAQLVSFFRDHGFSSQQFCFNPKQEGHYINIEKEMLELTGLSTNDILVKVEPPVLGTVTFLYFGYPVDTLYYILEPEGKVLYHPLFETSIIAGHKAEKNNVEKYSPYFKTIEDCLEEAELYASDAVSTLQLASAEVWTLIDKKLGPEIINICYVPSEPTFKAFVSRDYFENVIKEASKRFFEDFTWGGYIEPE